MSVDLKAGYITASDFINTIGVNTHAAFYMDGYANAVLVSKSLNYLGVNSVRDAYANYGAANQAISALASAGVKFDFIVSPQATTATLQEWVNGVGNFVKANPGAVIAVEGLNEVNLNLDKLTFNGDSSLQAAVTVQRSLYEFVKGNANLTGVPVINLSVGNESASTYTAIGDLSKYSDYANSHAYTVTAGAADAQQERSLKAAANASSQHKTIITETGYTTLAAEHGLGINDLGQAKLTLNALFNAFENGAARTFLYELFDSGSTSDVIERERHFGLFESDGTPKLAATAIHNLTTVLGAKSRASTSPVATGTKFTVSGLPSDGHSLTMAKGNGVFDVVIWRDVAIWDDNKDVAIAVATAQTRLNFGSVQKNVYVYDPLSGTAPIAVYQNVSSITLAMGDRPYIVELGAAGPVLEAPPLSATELTMTAAELVAQIDKLATAPNLTRITLSDSQVIPVATKETLDYILANYGNVLGKVSGAFSFILRTTGATWEEDKAYDATGKLTAETDVSFVNGVRTFELTVRTDGSSTSTRFASGKPIDIVDMAANGQKTTKSLDAVTGQTLWVKVLASDGSTVSTNYSNGKVISVVSDSSSGQHTVETIGSGDGTRTIWSSTVNGTETTTKYGSSGAIVSKYILNVNAGIKTGQAPV